MNNEGSPIMEKNIMLLFLSDVKATKPKREISTAPYVDVGETHTTNESAVRYLKTFNKVELDHMFAAVTKKVRNEHVDAAVFDSLSDAEKPTHLSYFKQRIAEVYPRIHDEDFFTDCPYREDAPADEMMQEVLKIAEKITAYVRAVRAAGDTVTLHIDTTGGMRHANMLLLIITRLLAYNDVKMGHVLYSDYAPQWVENHVNHVDEINGIYGLFDVIAGAEEFVRFGSVSALIKYFEDKEPQPPILSELLDAMKNFSEQIKLCHRGSFIDAAEELKEKLQVFSGAQDTEDAEVEEGAQWSKLMRQFEGRLHEDYREILEQSEIYIIPALIRWCLHHDHLQQALTLYIEAMPKFWRDSELVVPTEEGNRIYRDERHEPEYELFVEYETKQEKRDGKKAISYVADELKNILRQRTRKGKKEIEELLDRLEREMEEQYRIGFVSKENVCRWFQDLYRWFERGENEDIAGNAVYLSCRNILQNQKDADAASRHVASPREAVGLLGQTSAGEWEKYICPLQYLKEYRWEYLREAGLIEMNLPQEICGRLLKDYFRLRGERNHVNHAKTDTGEFSSAQELQTFMLDALDFLDEALEQKNRQ